ncbi:DUF445 family protein [Serpentinicella sp. ANB-PHB4]|uniref:DUF445 domain-containing protein n=1 Tax=Serpentinicella sp. ANB-PHB4 TaxID=3074076 RepID=UPI0028658B69|nr:DUF445 family protein [Serpentinicella sp. ANB-PHB4]MDR5659581.1 DUF445 family protein [Serpentinicella sp. ANB-PHB4]
MTITLLTMSAIGAIIGWLTNLLAIKLLFRPYAPIKIPVFNYYIQGLIPKRKNEIAKSIGKIIEEELLSVDDLIANFLQTEKKEYVINIIKVKVKQTIQDKIPSLIPSGLVSLIVNYIDEVIEEEAENVILNIVESIASDQQNIIQISKIVEEKVNQFSMIQLEEIVVHIAKKELKHIEMLGGVLGAVIGIVQGLIVTFIL